MKENFISSEEQMTLLENYFSSNRSEFVAIYGRWRFGKIFLVKELFENQFTFRMTVWQHQQNVSYCLYGSKIHMMTNLFQKKSYQFYKFGELLYLKSIPFEIWLPYIQEGFAKQGKHISEQLVRELCESVDYQSSYVQQLAYDTLLLTEKEVTEDILETAFNDLVDQNSIVFIEQTQSLTSYQLNFLRAVLVGQSTDFGKKDLREEYDYGSPSNIARLKNALTAKELIEPTVKGFVIGDPVLRLWLRWVLCGIIVCNGRGCRMRPSVENKECVYLQHRT